MVMLIYKDNIYMGLKANADKSYPSQERFSIFFINIYFKYFMSFKPIQGHTDQYGQRFHESSTFPSLVIM